MGSVGPRWDIAPVGVGLGATLGVGSALLLGPAGLPILAEVTHQRFGAFAEPVWGLRLTASGPFTWRAV